MTAFLVPADPLNPGAMDYHFNAEIGDLLTDRFGLVDLYELDGRRALKLSPELESPLIYRGWMLSPREYALLEGAVRARGHSLYTSSEAYAEVHQISGWLEAFESFTPQTVLVDSSAGAETILEAAATLEAPHGYFVKDLVKSEKYYPEASRAESLEELPGVIERLKELRAEVLSDSIAIRSFLPLDESVSEVRSWWLNGLPFNATVHPDSKDPNGTCEIPWLEMARVAPAVAKLKADFITVDFAKDLQGNWVVIEVGDGQVSGISPELNDVGKRKFYGELQRHLGLELKGPYDHFYGISPEALARLEP